MQARFYYAIWKKIGTSILTLVMFILLPFSCKKESGLKYKLEGQVRNARSGQAIPSANLDLTQQLVSGGSFNSNFVSAASGMSASDGTYALEWQRQAAAVFRLKGEKAGYFDRVYDINPDNLVTGVAYTRNVLLYPVATIEVHLFNSFPNAQDDLLNFRFDDTNFDCACCTENWIAIHGGSADTTFSCQLYGDQWLYYVMDLNTVESDTIKVDSVYCPAFQTTQLDISY